MSTIYGIYFKPIQKIVYVGQTIQSGRKRYYDHWRHAQSCDRNDKLHSFMHQYTMDDFEFQILLTGEYSRSELNELEVNYIQMYDTLSRNDNSSDDVYRLNSYKQSNVIQYHPHPKQVDWYNNTKQFVQTFNSIVEAEEKTGVNCVNISHCCNYLQTKTVKGWFRFHGDETPLEESYRPGIARPVARIDQFTLEILETYPSIQKAERIFGVNQCLIGQVCRGERYAGGGYLWCYVGEPIPTLNPTLKKIKTGVAQVDIKTKQVIRRFISIAEAHLVTNINMSGISHAAQHPLQNTSGGFYWIRPNDYRILIEKGEITDDN